jgi:16S rRNA (guanine1516-N2)-methyltransferase
MKNKIPAIAVKYEAAEQKERALRLAEKLELPVAEDGHRYDFILHCSDEGLELFRTGDPLLTGSVRAEFVGGKSGYRRNHGGTEMLVRAIGHKKNSRTRVLDATGGLGRDAFIMASHGCHVHIIEKNPVAAALLEDGLRRAAEHPDTKSISGRIRLTVGDSCEFLQAENQEEQFDVIYLDPMFPKRSKSALVKKELQILQLLVGYDDYTENLFAAALQNAGKRVVVKRPKTAQPLSGRAPSHNISSKTIRFDVYLASSQVNQVESS